MASKKAKSKEVAKKSATPSYLDNYHDEARLDISKDDILMPRLKLAQGMSDEVKDKKCQEGDFIHNITQQVLCKAGESMRVIVIAYSKEFILWYDRKGPSDGIAARARKVNTPEGTRYAWNVPGAVIEDKIGGVAPVKYTLGKYIEDDGLGEWGSQIPDDENSPPAATAHSNYIVCLPDLGKQLIAISLSRSADKVARQFNTLLKMGDVPECARIYTMSSFEDQHDDNRFANWQFSADWEPVPTEEEFLVLRDLAKSLADKSVTVDFRDGDEDASSGASTKTGEPGKF